PQDRRPRHRLGPKDQAGHGFELPLAQRMGHRPCPISRRLTPDGPDFALPDHSTERRRPADRTAQNRRRTLVPPRQPVSPGAFSRPQTAPAEQGREKSGLGREAALNPYPATENAIAIPWGRG